MAATSNQRNTVVLLGAAGLTSILAAIYLNQTGTSDERFDVVLQLSARIAFVLLLVVFVVRPLQQIFKTAGTARLLRNRRLIGISFAGVHIAHLGLLILKSNNSPEFQLYDAANYFGVLTYLVILAMLVTSWNRPARALGTGRWKILHMVGLYWLFVAFSQTQLPRSLDALETVNGWFIALITMALVIRLTAFLLQRAKQQDP